jgi:hypothetical protein
MLSALTMFLSGSRKSSFLTYYGTSPMSLIPSLCHPAIQPRENFQKLCQWPRPMIQVVFQTIGLLAFCQLCPKLWKWSCGTRSLRTSKEMEWWVYFNRASDQTTALLKITNDLLLASEEKLISILVLLDFSKAFDSVDHQLLCLKLSCQYKFSTSAVDLSMRPNAMGLERKSCIRDPASRIRCRTWISIRSTAFFIIHKRYHERYCIMYHVNITCMQTTYNFTLAAILQTLTIYYSGHCKTTFQSTRPNLRPWWLILGFYN